MILHACAKCQRRTMLVTSIFQLLLKIANFRILSMILKCTSIILGSNHGIISWQNWQSILDVLFRKFIERNYLIHWTLFGKEKVCVLSNTIMMISPGPRILFSFRLAQCQKYLVKLVLRLYSFFRYSHGEQFT